MHTFKSIKLENSQLLVINFSSNWDQDDISELSTIVFKQLNEVKTLEHVIGADREYFRFMYRQEYLILHFESYSNACWIESEDQLACSAIIDIGKQLNR